MYYVDGWNISRDKLELGDTIGKGEFTSENLSQVSRFCLDTCTYILHARIYVYVCMYVCIYAGVHTSQV